MQRERIRGSICLSAVKPGKNEVIRGQLSQRWQHFCPDCDTKRVKPCSSCGCPKPRVN